MPVWDLSIPPGFCAESVREIKNLSASLVKVVRERGLEPPPLSGPDPKSGVYIQFHHSRTLIYKHLQLFKKESLDIVLVFVLVLPHE